jgi:hypothetical protein
MKAASPRCVSTRRHRSVAMLDLLSTAARLTAQAQQDKPPADLKPEPPKAAQPAKATSAPVPKAASSPSAPPAPKVQRSQLDAVFRNLPRPEPMRVQFVDQPRQRQDSMGPVGAGAQRSLWQSPTELRAQTTPTPAPPPDPKAEAERILDVGARRWKQDDYPARLDAYADSLGKGDAAYQKQLLAEVLQQDPQAFGSWLRPGEINAAANSGKISQTQRTLVAQTFVSAYNDGLVPSFEHPDTGIDIYNFNPASSYYSNPVEQAKAVTEFLSFVDAAGSTPETREFRQNFAQYLTDSYALNDKLPVYDAYGAQVQNQAAALAALVISGDEQHPELAQIFMSSLAAGDKLDPFLQHVAAGSYSFTAGFLEPQLNSADPNTKVADIAQPDALSRLVDSVAAVPGADADSLAVTLARAPGDHGDWFRHSSERADAWTNLFNGHSSVILHDLTNPDGLPVSRNGAIEPAFKDRAHDLGAYMRLMNSGGDPAKIDEARGHVTDYANTLKGNIAESKTAEDAINNGRRLGFLGAAVTESVSQGFRDYAKTIEQKKALVGFALDLVTSAIPAGSLAKTALGDWFKDNIESTVIEESLKGFSGQIVDSATGKLTDEAKAHILSKLDEGDLSSLVAKLQESNEFIENSLLSDLPGSGFNPGQAGRHDTIQDVTDAYQIAQVWLEK